MSGFGSKILGNAVSSLNAQQAVIANIGNNIANANTDGYTRRVAQLETAQSASTGGITIGSGVQLNQIQRMSDTFLEESLRQAIAGESDAGIQDEFLGRVESVFSLVGENDTIGSALTSFFSSVDNLRVDPSNIERRREVLERAQDLTTAIRNTANQISALQNEADARLDVQVEAVNSITSQIAEINNRIASEEQTGRTANDARDIRDKLLQDLSERISFTSLENPNGSVTISLAGGFPLVYGGTARQLSTTRTPSFDGSPPPSIGGGTLSYIVYDYSGNAGTAHLDLTQTLAGGSGEIAGLLKTRGYHTNTTNTSAYQATGTLVELGARVESIAVQLLTRFNEVYRGPDIPGGNLAGDLNGNNPGVFGFFNFAGSADGNSNGIPDISDLTALRNSNPQQFASFASMIDLTSTDPRTIAAAQRTSAGVYQQGDGRNLASIGSLRSNNTLSFSVGSYSFTGTFEEVYNDSVTSLGNLKSRSQMNARTAADTKIAAANRRDSFSAVNMDEEFANLIKFQKAFQASARMVSLADELMETVVSLI